MVSNKRLHFDLDDVLSEEAANFLLYLEHREIVTLDPQKSCFFLSDWTRNKVVASSCPTKLDFSCMYFQRFI